MRHFIHTEKALFLTMCSLFSGFIYGNEQVKKARRDPEYFYKMLNIDVVSERPFNMEVTTPTGLKLRPALKSDLNAYHLIFSDEKTMANYLNGPETMQKTENRLEMYENRVRNGYVWTGLAIEKYGPIITSLIGVMGPHLFHRMEKVSPIKPQTKVIGNIAIGNGDEVGEVQTGIVIGANIKGKNYQSQGHGTTASRAAAAITVFHARNKLVTVNEVSTPVTTVSATALRYNIRSQNILKSVWGMKVVPDKKLDDDQRQFWSTSVQELKKRVSPK